VQTPARVLVDFYAINEKNLTGSHLLRIHVKDPLGKLVLSKKTLVALAGGDVYGQLIAEGVEIPFPAGAAGVFRVEATLVSRPGRVEARGHDEILALDWKSAVLRGKGAVWEVGSRVRGFLKNQKGVDAPAYRDDLERLDWVVISQPPNGAGFRSIPTQQLRDPSGKNNGLLTTFFLGQDFAQRVHQRMDETVNFAVPEGATPDPSVPTTENYGVRWEGLLTPSASGKHTFSIKTSGNVRLTVKGRVLVDAMTTRGGPDKRGEIDLEAGQTVPLLVEFRQQRGGGRIDLRWSYPERDAPDPQRLVDRARLNGTTLMIVDYAEDWMELIRRNTSVTYGGAFKVGVTWLGGMHFVRPHPLFKDLPVGGALDWPYQSVVRNGNDRTGFALEGEELVVGAWHSFPMQLGTAVGVIPAGEGRIVVSTLDLVENISSEEGPAQVARKLLCNFIEFAATP
jgi:hypothetical protein